MDKLVVLARMVDTYNYTFGVTVKQSAAIKNYEFINVTEITGKLINSLNPFIQELDISTV